MKPKVLKNAVKEDTGVQHIVAEAMRELEVEDIEGITKVVVEVTEDITSEFKKLIKEDENKAFAVSKLLVDEDLEKLKKDDSEMAGVLEKAMISYVEFLEDYHNEGVDKISSIEEAASNMLKPIGWLMENDKFKRVLPEDICSVVEVMEGLSKIHEISGKKETITDKKRVGKQRYRECCSAVFICYYHNRYHLSKAAVLMARRIQEDMISTCPENVTEPKDPQELENIPTGNISLESRDHLLKKILQNLKEDDQQVNAVGVYGMGGSGKTMLVKEVANNKATKNRFKSIALVEISEAPNIMHIQDEIAAQLPNFSFDDNSLPQRARKLNAILTLKEQRDRTDSDGKDILLILDNLWEKLNLEEVGIPYPNTTASRCKLLLTSREKHACETMGVREEQIHEVGILIDKEAWHLFREQVGECVDLNNDEYKSMAEKLLKKCGNLPLAIVGTANALKSKKLLAWKQFAKELEKPISSQDAGVHREAYSILQTSYKFIGNESKKRFFLLACVFTPGSSICVNDMMRYGIGLGLFQNVNSLSEAIDQSERWGKELVSSSLLLEDKDGWVKIHDVVRAAIISFAPKERQVLMVEAIPCWLWEESLRKYTAISLISGSNHSRLGMIASENLEILVLNNTQPSVFPENFFQGMVNLRVLSMSGMELEPSLPSSMGKLKKLRALFLEDCKLGDTALIGNLKYLLVLSFKGSVVRELPMGIQELNTLWLLDLNNCSALKKIPASVMSCLSQLEALYMKNSFTGWANVIAESSDNGDEGVRSMGKIEVASIAELGPLKSLTVLEMMVDNVSQLPTRDGVFVGSLDNFDIQVGMLDGKYNRDGVFVSSLRDIDIVVENRDKPPWLSDFFCKRRLSLGKFHRDPVAEYKFLKVLLKKTEALHLKDGIGLKHLVPNFNLENGSFNDLKVLRVQRCHDMKYIIGNTYGAINGLGWLPKLESMHLSYLSRLETIFEGCEAFPVRQMPMKKLQHLFVNFLPALNFYLLPVHVAPNLTKISVKECANLKFIFKERETDHSDSCYGINEREEATDSFRHLKLVNLSGMPKLESLSGQEEGSTSTGCPEVCQSLFTKKIKFPSLEELILNDIGAVKLFEETYTDLQEEPYISMFRKLKVIKIENCDRLESLCSLSVAAALLELETLSIWGCGGMRQVITEDANRADIVVLPNLKHLKLQWLPKLRCFYGGSCQLHLPELQGLQLWSIPGMTSLSGSGGSTSFFDEKIRFPSLNKLVIIKVGIKKLWDIPNEHKNKELFNSSFRKLKHIEITSCDKLESFSSPSVPAALEKLEVLTLSDCSQMREVICSESGAADTVDYGPIVFPNLNNLRLREMPIMTSFYGGCFHLQFPALQQLSFERLGAMTYIAEKVTFPSLKYLYLKRMNDIIKLGSWLGGEEKGCITQGCALLPKLKRIDIKRCGNLEYLFSPIFAAALHQLEKLHVRKCPEMLAVVSNDKPDASDIPNHQDQILVFSNLKELVFYKVPRLKSFMGGSRDVQLLASDTPPSQISTSFFNAKTRLPFLEGLMLNRVNENVDKIWEMDRECSDMISTGLRNPASYLETLELRGTRKESKIQVPYMVLRNLSCLELNQLDVDVLMQTGNGSNATMSKPISDCMHQFENLKKLKLSNMQWNYVFWVGDNHGRQVILMPFLEELVINDCSLEAVVSDGDNHDDELNSKRQSENNIIFPRLTEISIDNLIKARHFSNVNSSFEFPFLRELSIDTAEVMQSFLPTGRFVEPTLQMPTLEIDCYKLP